MRSWMQSSVGSLVLAAAFVAGSALVAPLSAQSDGEIDLTGEWVLTVESPNGTGTREVVFEQEGNELTGTYASSMSEGTIEGTVDQDDGTVMFTAMVAMSTGMFEILYIGTWDDGEIVDGMIDFGDYGEGTFTGVRVEDGEGGGR